MQSETTKDSPDFDSFLTWLYLNRKPVAIGAGIVVAVSIIFAIYSWKKGQNELDANAALFSLPTLVGAGGRTADVNAEDFQKVAKQYPNTGAAERADLIAAGVLFTQAKYPEAEKAFSQFLGEHGESPLRAQAALGVAASLEAQNKTADAIVKYQELITKYSGENIVPPAKLTLARLLETQNKPEEALKIYEELSRSNNPYDPWGVEARERREQLFQKYPNLKAQAAPPAPATNAVQVPAPSANSTPPATEKK